ncbi:MAG: formylglycine-generating enzyme family protein [Muribaculaceae bacterium]|nr:formylglycine-generating enzyme family protein [Muribaculaceae bacterium]
MKNVILFVLALLAGITAWGQEPIVREITVNGVSFKMVEVKGGRFNMGGTAEQLLAEDDEYPIHVVALDDFYIGQTEVTQRLWSAVMDNNPSGFTGDLDLPVERVMWIECQDFVSRLSQLTGIDFRLPTESEWEYAARGGIYNHYYVYSGSNDIDEVAWHDGDCTHVVAQKAPNELGLYDMSGNVFEWCQDWHSDYDMMPAENPTGPEDGENRVRRGGSWGGSLKGSRVSYRNYELPNIRWNYIGMRLAATTISIDEPTGINNIPETIAPQSNTRYNLIGQPASEDYKGIVIEDGQKRIKK